MTDLPWLLFEGSHHWRCITILPPWIDLGFGSSSYLIIFEANTPRPHLLSSLFFSLYLYYISIAYYYFQALSSPFPHPFTKSACVFIIFHPPLRLLVSPFFLSLPWIASLYQVSICILDLPLNPIFHTSAVLFFLSHIYPILLLPVVLLEVWGRLFMRV